MKAILVSFLSGVVFALGLGVGGMTQPSKVVGFLDFAGDWDPSLLFVMLGAIGVHSFFYHGFRARLAANGRLADSLPPRSDIEPRLISGAVIFGLGWGLAGYCPGPALTSLTSGNLSPVILTVGMLIGIIVFDANRLSSTRRRPAKEHRDEVMQDA